MNSSSQTNSRCSFTCGVNTPVECCLDVLEELWFGDSWVSEEKDVNVTSDFMFSLYIFWLASEHCKGKSGFDVFVTVNWRSDWVDNVVSNIAISCNSFLRKFSYLRNFIFSEFGLFYIMKSFNVVSFDVSWENWESMLSIHIVIKLWNVNTCDFNFISRPRRIN